MSRVYQNGHKMRVEADCEGINVPLLVVLDFLKDPETWIQALKGLKFEKDRKAIEKAVEIVESRMVELGVRIKAVQDRFEDLPSRPEVYQIVSSENERIRKMGGIPIA